MTTCISVHCALACFNPHTHAGCDCELCVYGQEIGVSIHTPTQGVTQPVVPTESDNDGFQSTHPRRVWLDCGQCDYCIHKFQSTHPRRVWHNTVVITLFPFCFNPHTHAGCDSIKHSSTSLSHSFNPHTHAGCDSGRIMFIIKTGIVSIHTPTQGVTQILLDSQAQQILFQSTHPRRVWLLAMTIVLRLLVSIHTPTQGVTLTSSGAWSYQSMFQSTHPRRVWHCDCSNSLRCSQFQSTHPRRVWRFISIFLVILSGFQSTHPRRVWRLAWLL